MLRRRWETSWRKSYRKQGATAKRKSLQPHLSVSSIFLHLYASRHSNQFVIGELQILTYIGYLKLKFVSSSTQDDGIAVFTEVLLPINTKQSLLAVYARKNGREYAKKQAHTS